ncbi:MAG: hypothetical protein KBT12_07445 [Bacteroidales bacterium]|nr:hypothetical protein [Candidatus Physcousia equi]
MERKLQIAYSLVLLITLGVYICFEFTAPLAEAPLSGIAGFEDIKYASEVITDLIAISFVYLALRLMAMPKVRRSIEANPSSYVRWAWMRWAMLSTVILLGIGVHYLFLSPSTIGCPIIGCLSLLFVWPTKGRRERECAKQEGNEEQ